MGFIIISEKILGVNYINVAMAHANVLMKDKGLDFEILQKEFNSVKSDKEFEILYCKYFGDDVKLIPLKQ